MEDELNKWKVQINTTNYAKHQVRVSYNNGAIAFIATIIDKGNGRYDAVWHPTVFIRRDLYDLIKQKIVAEYVLFDNGDS